MFYLKYNQKHKTIHLLILISILLINTSFAGKIEETFKKRLDCKDKSLITVKNSNGQIEITSWENDEVDIVAYKRVDGRSSYASKLMERIEIEVTQDDHKILIETIAPQRPGGGDGFFSWIFGDNHSSYSVKYEIKVPQQSDLDIKTTNGKIIVENINGHIRLFTSNGKIKAKNIQGLVHSHTTNGSIIVSIDKITTDEEMTFRTTNGSIKLYLPENYGGYANLKTTNGHIDSDYRLSSGNRKHQKSYKGDFGNGDGNLTCSTTNGSIYLMKNEN